MILQSVYKYGYLTKMQTQLETFRKLYSFELDTWQKEAAKITIEMGENTLITTPTGSGKTVAAEAVIFDCLERNVKVLYTEHHYSHAASANVRRYHHMVTPCFDSRRP